MYTHWCRTLPRAWGGGEQSLHGKALARADGPLPLQKFFLIIIRNFSKNHFFEKCLENTVF